MKKPKSILYFFGSSLFNCLCRHDAKVNSWFYVIPNYSNVKSYLIRKLTYILAKITPLKKNSHFSKDNSLKNNFIFEVIGVWLAWALAQVLRSTLAKTHVLDVKEIICFWHIKHLAGSGNDNLDGMGCLKLAESCKKWCNTSGCVHIRIKCF